MGMDQKKYKKKHIKLHKIKVSENSNLWKSKMTLHKIKVVACFFKDKKIGLCTKWNKNVIKK